MSGTDHGSTVRAARVGVDLSPIWRPSIASDTTVAVGLLEGLLAADIDPGSVVVAVDHHAPDVLPTSLRRFEVVRFRGGPRMFTNPSTLHRAYRSAGVEAGLYHHFGPVRRRHGSVTLVHDIVHVTDPAAFGRVEARYLDLRKTSVQRSTRILCPSHTTADELIRHGYRRSTTDIDVVRWGAALPSLDTTDRPPPGMTAPGSPFVLSVGRLTDRKRIPLAAAIATRCPDVERLVVAGPPDTPAIADELGRLPRVDVLGRVSDAELNWLYANASATLLTSRSEGFGLPLIESLQRGCPVLCSDLPVFREIGAGLDGVAYFTADGDDAVDAGVTELQRLIAAPRPGSNAGLDAFTWTRTAETVLNSLWRAAAEGTTGRQARTPRS